MRQRKKGQIKPVKQTPALHAKTAATRPPGPNNRESEPSSVPNRGKGQARKPLPNTTSAPQKITDAPKHIREDRGPHPEGHERNGDLFDETTLAINAAFVDSTRLLKALIAAVLRAGAKLAAMRELTGDEGKWVGEVQRRLGLTASEAYFFLDFGKKYRSLRQRLEPFVAIRLGQLLETIAGAFSFSETSTSEQSDLNRYRVALVPRPQTWWGLDGRGGSAVDDFGTESPPKQPKASFKAATVKKRSKAAE